MLAGVTLSLFATAPAGAAPTWLDPVASREIRRARSRQPDVAVDPQSYVVAVWLGRSAVSANCVVKSAVRMAGDSSQAPVDITSSAQNVAFAPPVAVYAQGNAVVIWQRRVGANYVIQGAVRPVDGAWEKPVELSGAGPNEDYPELAVDPQGNAYAVWQHRDGPGSSVQGAVRPAGGAWQEPVTLSAPGRPAEGAQIAVDPHGNAFAIWVGSDGTHSIVHSAVRPAGGTWQEPVDLSAASEDA